jgi:curved DNA-binding protein CbpA
MGTTEPTATGTLASTPFCELLVYSLAQGLSGSLVLECPDRTKHALLLQAGSPVKARVDAPATWLGKLLLQSGTIDAAALARAEAGPQEQLFGQRLFSQGAIDAPTLVQALRAQLLDQLSWLARAPEATAFAYYANVDLLQHWGGEQLHLDALLGIWRAVCAGGPEARIKSACLGLAEKTLRLHPASRIKRFGFGPRERSLLDVLRVKPQALAELEATGLIDGPTLRKVVYALALTRHLDVGVQPLGVAVGAPPSSVQGARRPTPSPRQLARRSAQRAAVKPPPESVAAAPVPEKAEKKEASQTGRFLTREEIAAKHQLLEKSSFYELLEVEPTATAQQIAEAFPALARRWHPDRLSPDLAELRDALTRVCARMTEASRVLGQAGTRQEYDQSLKATLEQENDQAQVVKVLRAAESFQKAEILLKKRDLAGAERFAAVAYAGDKDQPEYGALYAWIRALRVEPSAANLAESLTLLKDAVHKQPNNVKVRYYMACVLKLGGQKAAALREFRIVSENDPGNLDAARELRLHNMRKGQPEADGTVPPPAGIFGRLFKRGT